MTWLVRESTVARSTSACAYVFDQVTELAVAAVAPCKDLGVVAAVLAHDDRRTMVDAARERQHLSLDEHRYHERQIRGGIQLAGTQLTQGTVAP